MLTNILPQTTAGIDPEKFSDDLFFASDRRMVAVLLVLFMIIGFGLRTGGLGVESLGEDELNKLQTVEEYRQNGLSGRNGEHPFLMKGLQTLSISGAERLNATFPQANVPVEAALRFPIALFGTFTVLLLFLLVAELFGRSLGLISAALWAVEPMAIGFDRIAKEDSLVLFFFLLTNLFWVRGQTAAERGDTRWTRYIWATAAGFAGLMASKYYPHLLAVTAGYYNVLNKVPGKKWDIGKKRWLGFFAVMGLSFLVLNPTILFPETWREMLKFSSESRIGHDAYEYMGQLYTNKMTTWLWGVPWTFYYVFIAVKTSFPTLLLVLVGLPMLFRRQLGDGRFFLFIWAFFWFMPFTVLGGKFTRYFAVAEPLLFISAAAGFYFLMKWFSARLGSSTRALAQSLLFAALIAVPLLNSLSATPHFRMFTNTIGGGSAAAGSYFPHDEFYDAATRDVIAEIASRAVPGATIACETPALFEYYSRNVGRSDLQFISLSDATKVPEMKPGDIVVIAKGRRYFSNADYQAYLERSASPAAEVTLAGAWAARVYMLDETMLTGIREIASRP